MVLQSKLKIMEVKLEPDILEIPRIEEYNANENDLDNNLHQLEGDHFFSLDKLKQEYFDQSYKDNECSSLRKKQYKDLQAVIDDSEQLTKQLMDIGRGVCNTDNMQVCTHSIKTEPCCDFNGDEESEYNLNQIINENDKVHTEDDRSFCFIKNEDIGNLGNNNKCPKMESQDSSQVISSKHGPPQNDSSGINNNWNLNKFHCDFCDFSSPNKPLLRLHIKSIHLNLKKHKCQLCSYASSKKYCLRLHIKYVHLKEPIVKNHKCHMCDYCTSRNSCLQHHIKAVHLKLRNYKCDLCDHCSTTSAALQRHIISVHLKLRDYNCDSCSYSASRPDYLQRHINRVHLNQKNYKCHLCDHRSLTKFHLEDHIKSFHLKVKDHKCLMCDYCSYRKAHLEQHIDAVHLKLRNHKCHLCDYCASTKSHLQRHLKTVHLTLKTE